MREIGGYFEMYAHPENEFYADLTALNSARNGVAYLMQSRGYRKLYLPYFLCDSVKNMCDREGYTYAFYSVDKSFIM